MKQFKLDNGWVVRKIEGQSALLHVLPIPNSLFRKEMTVEIPEMIYRVIEFGETSVKELFEKHNLHDFIFQWESRKPITTCVYENSKDKFFGVDFLATKQDGSYHLIYELSRQGGRHRRIPINKEVYDEARTGKYSSSGLFKKYNLYHLDVPENDMKD